MISNALFLKHLGFFLLAFGVVEQLGVFFFDVELYFVHFAQPKGIQ